jgi:hypothetical protein
MAASRRPTSGRPVRMMTQGVPTPRAGFSGGQCLVIVLSSTQEDLSRERPACWTRLSAEAARLGPIQQPGAARAVGIATGERMPLEFLTEKGSHTQFAEPQFRGRLLDPAAEIRTDLRCVDSREADLDLLLFRRQDGERVAIAHADDSNGVIRREGGESPQQDETREEPTSHGESKGTFDLDRQRSVRMPRQAAET